jgi:hypothetical protein
MAVPPAGGAQPARSLLEEGRTPAMNGTDAVIARLPGRSRYSVSFL